MIYDTQRSIEINKIIMKYYAQVRSLQNMCVSFPKYIAKL